MFVCVHKYDAYHKSSQVWYRDVDSQCNLVLHRSSYALCLTKDCVWNHSTWESTQRVKRCKQLWSEWLLPGNLSSQTQWHGMPLECVQHHFQGVTALDLCIFGKKTHDLTIFTRFHQHHCIFRIFPSTCHIFFYTSSLRNWCVSRTLGDSLSTHEWDCIRYPPPLKKRIQSRHASRACHTWRASWWRFGGLPRFPWGHFCKKSHGQCVCVC